MVDHLHDPHGLPFARQADSMVTPQTLVEFYPPPSLSVAAKEIKITIGT